VVQKRSVNAEVYRFPVLDAGRMVTLEYVGTFAGGENPITGVDISADGRRLALISDSGNYHWVVERRASSSDVADFFTSPYQQWRIQFKNKQGEAIGFADGGYSFLVASEGGELWKIEQTYYDDTLELPDDDTYTLSWEGYDYDYGGEVSVLLNGREVVTLPSASTPANNNQYDAFNLDLSNYVVDGENVLTFRQNIYSSGVRNVLITGQNGEVVFSEAPYRSISAESDPSTTYTFELSITSPPPEPVVSYIIEWEGYDYDYGGEVSVLLNGREVVTLPSASTPANNNQYVMFNLDLSNYVVDGENVLTFRQNTGYGRVSNVLITGLNGVILSAPEQNTMWLPDRSTTTYTFTIIR
jgi:hypothetical protein